LLNNKDRGWNRRH